jgi:hypothetical protein
MKVWLGIALFSIVCSAADVVSVSDSNYSMFPTAPLSIRSNPKSERGEEAIELNEKIVLTDTACHLYPHQAGTEDVVVDKRTKVFHHHPSGDYEKSAAIFLTACEEIREAVGNGGCSAVEIGGHAKGTSIGLGGFIGFKIKNGKWLVYPEDRKLFNQIIGCIKDISKKDSPVIFSTCGGFIEEGENSIPNAKGNIFFFDKKKEAQDLMANLLDRTVISARGPENNQWRKERSDVPYAHSRYGWYVAKPTNQDFAPHSVREALPEVKPLWNRDGSANHRKIWPAGYDEKNDLYTHD